MDNNTQPPSQKAIIISISGISSSGKTTIARLLRDMFPEGRAFILHEDDFYKPEAELPMRDGLVDWDCPESIDIPGLESALLHVREHGKLPSDLVSIEDKNSVGPLPIPAETVQRIQSRVHEWLRPTHRGHTALLTPSAPRICLLDGFLLYCPAFARALAPVDVRLFLRASLERARARRQARDGYATVDGFWTDPPGYVDRVVWPNYVQHHAWMFGGGDVEQGKLDREALDKAGVRAALLDKGADAELGEVLEWVVETVIEEVERLTKV